MNKKTRKKDTGKPKITRGQIVEILNNNIHYIYTNRYAGLYGLCKSADEIMKRLEG